MGRLAAHTKPILRVVATGNRAVAELRVVPETTNVKATSDEQFAATNPDEAASVIEVTLEPRRLDRRFFLAWVAGFKTGPRHGTCGPPRPLMRLRAVGPKRKFRFSQGWVSLRSSSSR